MNTRIYLFVGGLAFIIGLCLVFNWHKSLAFVSEEAAHFRAPSQSSATSSAVGGNINTASGNSLPVYANTASAPALQSSNASNAVVAAQASEIPATIQIEGKGYDIKPNSIGSYPRFTVPAKAIIPIHLQAAPGETVQEQVLDGGRLDDESISRLQQADASGNLDFKYQVKSAPGAYRMAIYRNGQRQIFNFWVGPDLPQRVSAK